MRTSKGTAERRPIRRFCVAQNLPHVPADVVNRLDAQTMLGVLGQIDEDYRAPRRYISYTSTAIYERCNGGL